MKKLEPYIGINGGGFNDMRDIWKLQNESPKRDIIMGVQATEKTQVYNQENKYGSEWHPVGRAMKAWWVDYGWKQMLHVNTDGKEPASVAAISRLMLERTIVTVHDETDLGTPFTTQEMQCSKVQFNNLPFYEQDYLPLFEMLATETNPKTRKQQIVLQANADSMDALTPAKFAKEIKRYEPTIAGVLLDPSGGKGTPLNATKLRRYIDKIYDMDVAVGIAGGLNAETVEPLAGKLLYQYPSLSVDAESGLRSGYFSDRPSKSTFSFDKALSFVKAVNQLVR